MRAHSIVAAVLLMLSMTALVAPSNAEMPRAYLIEVKLTATLPDGGERVLGCPHLMTLEGQEACVQIGQDFAPPKGVEVQEPLRAGIYCQFKVLRKDGQLFLDATATKSIGEADADGVSITTTGVHLVKAITLGRKITAPLDKGSVRCEALVQEVPSTIANATARAERFQPVPAPAQTPAAAAAKRPDSVRQ